MLLLAFAADGHALVSGESIRKQVVRHIERTMPWPRDAVRIDVDTPPDVPTLADRSTIKVETSGMGE